MGTFFWPSAPLPVPVCLPRTLFEPVSNSRSFLGRSSFPSSCSSRRRARPLRGGVGDGSRCGAASRTPEPHPSTYPTTPSPPIHTPCAQPCPDALAGSSRRAQAQATPRWAADGAAGRGWAAELVAQARGSRPAGLGGRWSAQDRACGRARSVSRALFEVEARVPPGRACMRLRPLCGGMGNGSWCAAVARTLKPRLPTHPNQPTNQAH